MFFSGSQVYGADSQKFGEYELKAAFIFNFAKFVTWPEHHFSVRKNTIDLCVYGSGFPINTFNYFEGKTAQGQIFRTKRLKDLSAVDGCDMLFVCASERYRITQIINKVKDMPILTIGDTEGFGEKGVMINLYIEDDKVRFEINLDAAKDAGLFISSQLLKLGRIIQKKR
ncbi:MAG TPA: YfiR family protein [Syntrophorhabdaceae bacterium]|nr:YfiR family protein [Syntrophorhabdaceae bacterium]